MTKAEGSQKRIIYVRVQQQVLPGFPACPASILDCVSYSHFCFSEASYQIQCILDTCHAILKTFLILPEKKI
jgi:hypothetical protein